MTQQQKTVVAILAIANALVILTLALLATRAPTAESPPSPTPESSPDASPTLAALPSEACQWKAAQRLARTGLGGAVTLTPGDALHLRIVHTLAPGQTADDAAQSVWTAFDVALALAEEDGCNTFTQVQVTVLAQDDQTSTQVSASVSAADLTAFGAGELSEDAFIDRVTYTVKDR